MSQIISLHSWVDQHGWGSSALGKTAKRGREVALKGLGLSPYLLSLLINLGSKQVYRWEEVFYYLCLLSLPSSALLPQTFKYRATAAPISSSTSLFWYSSFGYCKCRGISPSNSKQNRKTVQKESIGIYRYIYLSISLSVSIHLRLHNLVHSHTYIDIDIPTYIESEEENKKKGGAEKEDLLSISSVPSSLSLSLSLSVSDSTWISSGFST